MSRKKIAALTFFLLILLGSAFWLHRQSRLRRDQRQRDGLLASTLSKLSSDIKVGTTRAEVDAYFRIRHIEFFERSDYRTYSDLTPLGRRPSGVWYCGPIQFGVEIEFNPSVPGVPFEATPSDTVAAVHSYEWADNCL